MFAAGAPFPRAWLVRSVRGPRVATGHVDAVLIDVTRPAARTFRVRIFDERYAPPEADVVAAFILYGARVGGVAERLLAAWRRAGLLPTVQVRSESYCSFDHPAAFGSILRTVEALQRDYLP